MPKKSRLANQPGIVPDADHAGSQLVPFQTIIEALPDAVVATDQSGRVTLVNTRVQEMFGYHPEQLIGQPLDILLPERFRNSHAKFHKGYFADPSPRLKGLGRELVALRQDGTEFPVEIGLSTAEIGGEMIAIAFVTDITERKQIEERTRQLNVELEEGVKERTAQLVESEEKFFKIFWANPAGISIAAQADGRWIEVNEALMRMTGYSRDEMIGHTSAELGLVDQSAREKILQATREKGAVRDVEIQVRTKLGQMLDVLLSTEQIEIGGQMCVVAIQYDISERKRAEAVIQQLNDNLTQRQAALEAVNQELESFSYSVSHDLRAPLRAIAGFSRILEEDYASSLDVEGLRYLGQVRDGAQQMGMLIDDLLAFSRLGRQAINRQTINMSQLARDVLAGLPDDLERKANVQIADLPETQADIALLRQVFANLLGNALKFSHNASQPLIEVGCEAQNGDMVYFVRDNGAGFDMQYASKLFGVFQRLHRAEEFEGTGVGLATVQRIINRHGGRIWAEAAVGRGATFYFTIGKEIATGPLKEQTG